MSAGAISKACPVAPAGRSDRATSRARIFFADMHGAWLERGREVICRLIAERPEIFLMAMLKITQVHRVQVGQPENFDRPSSKEEALRRLEQSSGPKARKMLEDFLAKVEKLERNER